MLRYEEGLKWSLPISQGVVPNGTAELTVKSGSLEELGEALEKSMVWQN